MKCLVVRFFLQIVALICDQETDGITEYIFPWIAGLGGRHDARAGEPGVRSGAPPPRRPQADLPSRRGR